MKNRIRNLLWRLTDDRLASHRIVRAPHRGVEKSQVVIDFRGRSDGRTRIGCGRPLFDGDGRREALDVIDFRLLHLIEKLARIGGKAFDVLSLALRVEGVKSQRGFSRSAQAGNNHKLVARDLHVEVLQIVLPRSLDSV